MRKPNDAMIRIERITSSDLRKCLEIRKIVFVDGQNVPLDREVDGLDPSSDHYLLSVGKNPAGTARIRFDGTKAKIERVAILPDYRGLGLGKRLMIYIIDDLKINESVNTLVLSSQVHAIPFYSALQFEVCSEEYLDATIPHRDMKRKIRS